MTGEKRSIALRLPGIMYHKNVILKVYKYHKMATELKENGVYFM